MDVPNVFFFIGLPYLAAAIFFIGTVYRYRTAGYKVSSLSSQFLEGNSLFWGAVPFHFGILVVFFGHLIAWLLPGPTLAWNADPVRLIVLEVTAFVFGLSTCAGLLVLFVRRITNDRVRMVTTRMDVFLELLLLAQVILGLWIALGHRWGASWFAADLSPYLTSVVLLNPQIEAMSAMPIVIKLHVIGAFLIVAIFPFTRLIHFLVAPLHYIGRPYQQVLWNWSRTAVRDPNTPWAETRPKNN